MPFRVDESRRQTLVRACACWILFFSNETFPKISQEYVEQKKQSHKTRKIDLRLQNVTPLHFFNIFKRGAGWNILTFNDF